MKQQIIVISGLPCSGKSSLAEALATKLQIPLLSVDPIESATIEAGFAQSYQTGLAAYLVAKALAAEQLKTGNKVIIDAVNAEEEAKDTWRDLAQKFELPLSIIETTLNETEHRRRVESRVRNLYGLPEVTWSNVLERRKNYTRWKEQVLKIDTALGIEANVALAIQYLLSK